jgi:hypothetical protein
MTPYHYGTNLLYVFTSKFYSVGHILWHKDSKPGKQNQKRRPLIGNGFVNNFLRQKTDMTAVTIMYATTEELLGELFSVGSAQRKPTKHIYPQ